MLLRECTQHQIKKEILWQEDIVLNLQDFGLKSSYVEDYCFYAI